MAVALQFIEGLRLDDESTICAALGEETGWDRNGVEEKAAIAKVAESSRTGPGLVAQVSQSTIGEPIAFFSGQTGEIVLNVATKPVHGTYVVDWDATVQNTTGPSPFVKSLNIEPPHKV